MPFPDGTAEGHRVFLSSFDGAATPNTLAFMDLDAGLAAHADPLVRLDPAEVHFIVARGERGRRSTRKCHRSSQADNDAHGATERLERHVVATVPDRLRHRGLGSRRRSFIVRQARERRLAVRVRTAADRLHHAPVEACGDIALKLAAIIAVAPLSLGFSQIPVGATNDLRLEGCTYFFRLSSDGLVFLTLTQLWFVYEIYECDKAKNQDKQEPVAFLISYAFREIGSGTYRGRIAPIQSRGFGIIPQFALDERR